MEKVINNIESNEDKAFKECLFLVRPIWIVIGFSLSVLAGVLFHNEINHAFVHLIMIIGLLFGGLLVNYFVLNTPANAITAILMSFIAIGFSQLTPISYILLPFVSAPCVWGLAYFVRKIISK